MHRKDYPLLIDTSSTGAEKEYNIFVVSNDDGTAAITTVWGYKDKTKQAKVKEITQGKNMGKKNETTPYQQACKEAKSTWKRKIDSGYKQVEVAEDGDEKEDSLGGDTYNVPLPMLAHSYEKRKHNISWPALVQPKLDGMRVLVYKDKNGAIHYWSRKGKKVHTLEHLSEDLKIHMRTGEILDGEIYIHGEPFQEIISLAKNPKKDTERLEFWIFDIVDTELTNLERFQHLLSRGLALHTDEKSTSKIKLVVPMSSESEDFAMLQHDVYVQEGFEGLIIRNLKGMYTVKHRSPDLQKYKQFVDEEFPIIGSFTDADGGVVWQCSNAAGLPFGVRPKGTIELRTAWANNSASYIGMPLTVRYQNLSPDGIPIFPVGIAVRDYE